MATDIRTILILTCDICGDTAEINLTCRSALDLLDLRNIARKQDKLILADDQIACTSCWEDCCK